MRSSSYHAMMNMIANPTSKPKFCSTNVMIGSFRNASLCIRSGSCKDINKTALTDRIKPKTTLFYFTMYNSAVIHQGQQSKKISTY